MALATLTKLLAEKLRTQVMVAVKLLKASFRGGEVSYSHSQHLYEVTTARRGFATRCALMLQHISATRKMC